MNENIKSNYYAIIPAVVRYDRDLTDKAKLLYSEITCLCNKEGYCFVSNKYFADCYMKLNDYDGDNIEKFLLQLKRKTYGEKNVIWRLRVQPHFTGKGGHNLGNGPAFFYSTDQDSSVLRFKRSIRQLLRWSAPWWWC